MIKVSYNQNNSLIRLFSEMSDFGQKVNFIQSTSSNCVIEIKSNDSFNNHNLVILNGNQCQLNHHDTYMGIQRHRIKKIEYSKNILFLGDLKSNYSLMEIYSRNATNAIIDLNVLKKSEIPKCNDAKPSGLSTEEFAQLGRYLGFSNAINKITISNSDETLLLEESTLNIIAEFIWYFVEGATLRIKEHPLKNDYAQIQYLQHSQFTDSLVLIKSKKSDRHWIKKDNSETLIPCTKEECDQLKNDQIPKRLWELLLTME